MGGISYSVDTTKVWALGGTGRLYFASSAMRGWGITMDDVPAIVPDLTGCVAWFAVFDGHGGIIVTYGNVFTVK
jgi:hypothetical protein